MFDTANQVQIETTVRNYLMPVGKATMEKKKKKKTIASVDKDVEKLEPFTPCHIIIRNVKCCSFYGKQYEVSSEN